MEPLDDEQIQRALEENIPISQTADSAAYQRLFQALRRAPALQPSTTFSQRVVTEVNRQQTKQEDRAMCIWIAVGSLFSLWIGLSYWIDPSIYRVTFHAFGLARGWLLVGIVCLSIFLVVEHQFLVRTTLGRLDNHA